MAARRGLRLETSGETGVRMQLPLAIQADDREKLLRRFALLMEGIERRATAGINA